MLSCIHTVGSEGRGLYRRATRAVRPARFPRMLRKIASTMAAARLRRLTLTNFRSYRAAQIAVGPAPIVLVGPNGAGKTNLIEAISLLAPGRGLRRATLEEVAFAEGDGSWAVAADVEGAL